MRVVGTRAKAAPKHPPLSTRHRAGSFAALALLFLFSFAPSASAQWAADSWTVEAPAFADLWFHGLSVVGLHGFGTVPLYSPDYALEARADRAGAGLDATSLERQRAPLLRAFQSDDAFEVFHFVPLYFAGVDRAAAMSALRSIAEGDGGLPPAGDPSYVGAQVVAGLLPEPGQRQILGRWLDALDEEWTAVVGPRRDREATARAEALQRISSSWSGEWLPALASFLDRERIGGGRIYVLPALSTEGRFLERSPDGDRPVVAVGGAPGHTENTPTDEILSSVVRELCYPVVRRAFGPFEGRFDDRRSAARASDLTATRCGELLVERLLPEKVVVYRSRFGLAAQGTGAHFLSASGEFPGAAAWEARLDGALQRELNFER